VKCKAFEKRAAQSKPTRLAEYTALMDCWREAATLYMSASNAVSTENAIQFADYLTNAYAERRMLIGKEVWK
jgi:hypothetical protein